MRALLLCLAAAGIGAAQTAELDIAYGKESRSQTLDLYVPAGKSFATIVYTYGGGWHAGSGKSSKPIAEKLQSLGYGCALVTHRLSPPDVFPSHAEDLAAAFAWIKANIGARGGDSRKLVLAGHSSGAHLSLLLATDPRYLGARGRAISDVTAVIGLSAPLDLAPRADGRGYGDVLLAGQGAAAFGRDAALMKDASPLQHVSKSLPPTLLVAGEQDFPMLADDARAFARKAAGEGRKVEVLIAPRKDHMAVARGMLDDADPVLRGVLEFLRSVM